MIYEKVIGRKMAWVEAFRVAQARGTWFELM